MNDIIKENLEKAQHQVEGYAMIAAKWKDFRKPLKRKAPMIGGMGQAIQANLKKRKKIRAVALGQSIHAAKNIQEEIEKLWDEVDDEPQEEPQRSINLFYLRIIADATVGAAVAYQKMGKSIRRSTALFGVQLVSMLIDTLEATHVAKLSMELVKSGFGKSVILDRLASAWVVYIGCGLAPLVNQKVQEVARRVYPLMSGGLWLEDTIDPFEAIKKSYDALGV